METSDLFVSAFGCLNQHAIYICNCNCTMYMHTLNVLKFVCLSVCLCLCVSVWSFQGRRLSQIRYLKGFAYKILKLMPGSTLMFSQFQDRNFQGFTKIHKTSKYFPQKFLAMQYVRVMCVCVCVYLSVSVCLVCIYMCMCVFVYEFIFCLFTGFLKPMETSIQYYSEVMML